MATQSRIELKNKWISGYKPDQAAYVDLFDSFYNVSDDRVFGPTGPAGATGSTPTVYFPIGASVDGLGTLIQSGQIGFSVAVSSGTIQSWSLIGSTSSPGNIVIDVKRNGTSIVGAGNKPTIINNISATASVVSWTSTSLIEGDFIEYVIESVDTFTKMYLYIKVRQS